MADVVPNRNPFTPRSFSLRQGRPTQDRQHDSPLSLHVFQYGNPCLSVWPHNMLLRAPPSPTPFGQGCCRGQTGIMGSKSCDGPACPLRLCVDPCQMKARQGQGLDDGDIRSVHVGGARQAPT